MITAISSPLAGFADQTTVILTTFRRDGTPVDTPVHVAVAGGRAFVRTYDTAFKARRLRRRPEGELWRASDGSALALVALLRPQAAHRVGEPVHVRVRELAGDESRQAAATLARKYPLLHGVLIPWAHRLRGARTVNLELSAA